MRVVRVPYTYLPDGQLSFLHKVTHRLLNIISDIHNDVPNTFHNDATVRHYQYYPAFLRWAHNKAAAEMLKRGINHRSPLRQDILDLRSRSLDYFIPPTDMEIAEDVVYLLERWKRGRHTGGQLLPYSYLELVLNVYNGYCPDQKSLQRIGEVSGHHYHSDAGWYLFQSQA